MAEQQQFSSFAQGLGARLAQANAQHASAPIDTGNRRLPPGIKEGVAKLTTCYFKQYADDKAFVGARGKTFFYAAGVVMAPTEFNGRKVAGMLTSQVIPLCDKPAKDRRPAVSFEDNWYDFQNVMKILGVPAPQGPQYTLTGDPHRDTAIGLAIEAYYHAAAKSLIDPVRVKTNPVYFTFSTRGWTPPATPQSPNPEMMVFETWHEQTTFDSTALVRPGAGMSDNTGSQPAPGTPPPSANGSPARPVVAAPAVTQSAQAAAPEDEAQLVASLVDTALSDPDGATEEGSYASGELEKMAWARGWTKEQTLSAAEWGEVGGRELPKPPPPLSPRTH